MYMNLISVVRSIFTMYRLDNTMNMRYRKCSSFKQHFSCDVMKRMVALDYITNDMIKGTKRHYRSIRCPYNELGRKSLFAIMYGINATMLVDSTTDLFLEIYAYYSKSAVAMYFHFETTTFGINFSMWSLLWSSISTSCGV